MATRIEGRGEGVRILFVDDDKLNRLVMTALLEKRDIIVEAVSSGAAALDVATVNHYDLILMDLQMPEMSGYEASRAIREAEQSKGLEPTPIFAFSALLTHEERSGCLLAGIDDALSKPINVDKLFEKYHEYQRTSTLRRRDRSEPQPKILAINESPLFDSQVIESEFGKIEAEELLGLYVTHALKQMRTILDVVPENDFQLIEERAHKLKGPSSQYGAMRLFVALRNLEMAGKSKSEELVIKTSHELEKIFVQTIEAIAARHPNIKELT